MQDILLTRIQNWYKINCNGDWEHQNGISIETIDNPGWKIKINLLETSLENLKFELSVDNGRFDWMSVKTENEIFEAQCDPTKLEEVLRIFLEEIIPKYTDNKFYYEVYVPLIGSASKVWRPIKARMLTEETLEITEIPELRYEDIK